MGTISLEHSDRLFWLGRYTERSFTTLKSIQRHFDKALDTDPQWYQQYLTVFGLTDIYGSREAFLRDFLFNEQNANSVLYSLYRAYDNGIVLREDISTETLSYLQIAMDTLEKASLAKDGLLYELLALQDILYSFRGSLENHIYDTEEKALIDCGQSIERMDLYFRLHYTDEMIRQEFERLCDRLRLIPKNTPYQYNTQYLSALVELMGETDMAKQSATAVYSLGNLFAPQKIDSIV